MRFTRSGYAVEYYVERVELGFRYLDAKLPRRVDDGVLVEVPVCVLNFEAAVKLEGAARQGRAREACRRIRHRVG